MKNLSFIADLTEARMFQGIDDLKGKTAENIADVIYLIIMLLEIIRANKPEWAANYASQTLQYNTYDNMHYSGTDLANLLAVLNRQDTFKATLKVNAELNIPLFQINRYLNAVKGRNDSSSDDATFFYRLEDYLKLYSKPVFRRLRRDIGQWNKLSYADKVRIIQMLRQEFDKRASTTDIYLWFKQSFRLKESVNEDINIGSAVQYHNTMNPKLWDANHELHQDVRFALEKIANKFAEFVDVDQIAILDYIITGSNCAFNYTEDSDIDLHVVVDATALGNNPLTEPFLMAKKSLWNSGHDITVKGYDVELYAEDANNKENKLVATGIYSLLKGEWVKKPEHDAKISINDSAVKSKAQDIIDQIDAIIAKSGPDDEAHVERLWQHIRKMRRAGLDKDGEFSVENLAFKVVRNAGYFDKLNDYEKHGTDQALSLESEINTSI
jgi:hypothetical protein